MKSNQLNSVGKLLFFGLLSGVFTAENMPAFAENTINSINKSAEISTNNSLSLTANYLSKNAGVVEPTITSKNLNNTLPADIAKIKQQNLNKLTSEPVQIAQITSVSQLSDVQPTDWAFQALQSLVERYGCIAGYPDRTFRGNRALTRYEFAAGLNACMDKINQLIGAGVNSVKKEDLVTLQKLQEQFASEIAALRGRVDALEARTAELEANQFSTTTKLQGEVIIAAVAAAGGDKKGVTRNGKDANAILVNRVRLNLNTSFSGKDLLITGLQMNNFGGGLSGAGSVQGTLFPGASTFTEGMTKLGFEPQFPRFNPSNLSTSSANSVELYKLLYIFPAPSIKNLTLFAGTQAEVSDAFPAIIPFASEGQGAISRFGGLNPVLRVSGGTTQTGLASAVGFIWNVSPKVDLRALYGNVNGSIPGKGANNPLGAGFFGGSSIVATQLTLKPAKTLDIGINYANSYHEINILGLGLASVSSHALNIPGSTGLGPSVNVNSIGSSFAWRFAPKVALTGYGAYFFADSANGPSASSTFNTYMVGLYFSDLFKKGNTAGLIFGQPLHRISAGGAASLKEAGTKYATPYQVEAFYKFQVNDNLSITPGGFILFNAESDSRNDVTKVGVLRTTFTF